MAVAKFGLKLYQKNYGTENITIDIVDADDGDTVVSNLEITAKESSSPQEVVWEDTADYGETKNFRVVVTNDSNVDVSGWIAGTATGNLVQYTDGNWYQGPWRGEHASDANSPWPVGRTGGPSDSGGTLISGVKEVDRPEAEYFTTSAEQRAAGAPDQQTKYIVKDTDGNTLNWTAQEVNTSIDEDDAYSINIGLRFLSSV